MLHFARMTCPVCRRPVIAKASARYCSASCRQQAYRARKAAQRPASVDRALRQLRVLESQLQGPFLKVYLPPLRAAITLLTTLGT